MPRTVEPALPDEDVRGDRSENADSRQAMRGIALGMLLGLVSWVLLGAAVWAIW